MNKEESYEKALIVAIKAHKGQKRWNGDDYITHPLRVADCFEGYDLKTIAILHDVLEDSSITERDLVEYKFPGEVVKAVVALTKIKGEDYYDFIMRCRRNHRAVTVKISDINDNLRDSKPGSLRDKYLFARHILMRP